MKKLVLKKFFANKTIMITGGTGSFGRNFTNYLLKNYPKVKKIIIFSRDELKQFQMANEFENRNKNKLRFFIGDIRDKDRLRIAVDKVDYIIHAAALKQVPAAEYNPFEAIKTNILGAQNLIEVCLEKNVKRILALSTDKACSPVNLYGATKLCSDKIFIAANNFKGDKKSIFSVLRYGNVFGSRGSVAKVFLDQKKKNIFTLTDKRMTRFHISIDEAIKFAEECLVNSKGSEIFVPKIPSFRILDLIHTISPNAKIKEIGIRPGEKIHEELLNSSNARNTFDKKNFYILVESENEEIKKHYKEKNFKLVNDDFSYNSGNNKKFLKINDLKKLISNMSI